MIPLIANGCSRRACRRARALFRRALAGRQAVDDVVEARSRVARAPGRARMKERLFTLACALGALAAVRRHVRAARGRARSAQRYSAPHHRRAARQRLPRRHDLARGGEGARHLAARPVRQAGATSRPWRPPAICSSSRCRLRRAFNTEEFVPLDRWIRAGNTLLVLAALSDIPDWAFVRQESRLGDLNLLTGLEFETVRAGNGA